MLEKMTEGGGQERVVFSRGRVKKEGKAMKGLERR